MSSMDDYAREESEAAGLNKRANAIVSVSIANPSSSSLADDGYVNLRVEERASGSVLVDVEIPAGRFYRLLQGGQQVWPAFVTSYPERIRKRMENEQVGLGPVWGMNEEAAKEAAAAHPLASEYETQSVHKTNSGWVATYRRWVE